MTVYHLRLDERRDYTACLPDTAFVNPLYSHLEPMFRRLAARDAAPKGIGTPCKRCLASLAKLDREFQRKARCGLRLGKRAKPSHPGYEAIHSRGWWPNDAARAIAREEGRAL